MSDINTSASAWLLQNARGIPRPHALQGCAAHLIEAFAVSQDTADRISLHALAELESRNQRARIDVGASTSHVVVVHRPGRDPLAFTVSDLLRMATAQASQLAAAH